MDTVTGRKHLLTAEGFGPSGGQQGSGNITARIPQANHCVGQRLRLKKHSSVVRLNSIKLSGFKSFAEPTNFLLPGQLVGVVGPNGCGKSNIMDAVRWVLGESMPANCAASPCRT